MEDKLNWEFRIDTMTNKANKTLGFLRRNLNIGKKEIKKTAYEALIRPILEYSVPVLDPHTANDIAQQERCNAEQKGELHIDTTRPPASTPSSTLFPGLHSNNAVKKPDSKSPTSFTIASSPLILHSYQNQQKTDYTTERTISLSCKTRYRHMSFFPEQYLNGTACPMR